MTPPLPLNLASFVLLLTLALHPGFSPHANAQAWNPLFNGRDLQGWTQRGGQAVYTVDGDSIVGQTVPRTPNSFLCTDRPYTNFILELEFKVDQRMNSGIQFRSRAFDHPARYPNGIKTIQVPPLRVHGYQFEIDPSDRRWSGGIYDESCRGWLVSPTNNPAGQLAFKRNEWNHARIRAVGPQIQTWLNDVPIAELNDTLSPAGFIALQVHGVRDREEPMLIRWRNIRIQELPNPTPAPGLPGFADLSLAITRGERFLQALHDPTIGLLPEFPGSKTVWYFHDNYLAAHLLASVNPTLANSIRAHIASVGVTNSGKIEILLGQARDPLPFRIPELVTLHTNAGFTFKTERLTSQPQRAFEKYADLLLLGAIAHSGKNRDEARRWLAKALTLWDGTGFKDDASTTQNLYATYKLALALLAARATATDLPMRNTLLQRLALQQDHAGGWTTDYTPDGSPHGFANVETTCIVLLALRTPVLQPRP